MKNNISSNLEKNRNPESDSIKYSLKIKMTLENVDFFRINLFFVSEVRKFIIKQKIYDKIESKDLIKSLMKKL